MKASSFNPFTAREEKYKSVPTYIPSCAGDLQDFVSRFLFSALLTISNESTQCVFHITNQDILKYADHCIDHFETSRRISGTVNDAKSSTFERGHH